MNRSWSLQEELYISFHRWSLIAAFSLLGCAIGWLSSFLFPSYYRATAMVYVGLNPYRTYSDTQFLALARPKYSNIDDYKDWQMTQLETVIFLDEFIISSLDQLQSNDPAWLETNIDQLREIFEADWRTAGAWSLIANHKDPKLASQAAAVWGEVAVNRVDAAIIASRNAIMVDQELQAISEQNQTLSSRLAELEFSESRINNWRDHVQEHQTGKFPNGASRWEILYQASRPAKFTPAWMRLLEAQPSEFDSIAEYLIWTDRVLGLISEEILSIQDQIQILEGKRTDLFAKFQSESEISLGLSPNLEIQGIENLPPEEVRPTSTLILIGGGLGVLIWVLTQLFMITHRKAPS